MDNLKLDPNEQLELSELGEVSHTVLSAGWARIKLLLDSLVDEAYEDMVGCHGDFEERAMRHIRWQQRIAMQRAIENYANDCVERRKLMLEEINEREKGSVPPYAE